MRERDKESQTNADYNIAKKILSPADISGKYRKIFTLNSASRFVIRKVKVIYLMVQCFEFHKRLHSFSVKRALILLVKGLSREKLKILNTPPFLPGLPPPKISKGSLSTYLIVLALNSLYNSF